MRHEPALVDIEHDVRDLLVEQEMAQLATLTDDGRPSASTMHIAGDGLAVYMSVFPHVQKSHQMQDDPRVGHTASRLPPVGCAGRFDVVTIQVEGRARLVTDPAENAHAAALSVAQFDWATPGTFKSIGRHQTFFRIEPTEAVRSDDRVGLMGRMVLDVAPDGSRFTGLRACPAGQY